MVRTIKMDESLASALEKILEREMDEEFAYRLESDGDDSHFEELLKIYEAVLPKPRSAIEAVGQSALIIERKEEMHKLYLRRMRLRNPNDDSFR